MTMLSEVTVPNLATLVYVQEIRVHLVLFQYRVITMHMFYFNHLRLALFAPRNTFLDSLAKYSSATTS
jgi:hypothetical protein